MRGGGGDYPVPVEEEGDYPVPVEEEGDYPVPLASESESDDERDLPPVSLGLNRNEQVREEVVMEIELSSFIGEIL
jgi:hypothetical protein